VPDKWICRTALAGPALSLALLLAVRLPANGPAFKLRPDWDGPCRVSPVVDVNLGNSPTTFIQACYCQIRGRRPDAPELDGWIQRLQKDPGWRRVDVVRSIAQAGHRSVALTYSDPWLEQPELPAAGPKRNRRSIGAAIQSFFNCPDGTNCVMDWANNHVEGMQSPSTLLAFQGKPGYYCADQPGFWLRELRDARAAGLDFLVADAYGPDLESGRFKTLAAALAAEPSPVKIALSDDPWAWGEPWFGPAWRSKPSFNDPETCAALLYATNWKPFFTQVPRSSWYLVHGRPLIFFYNAGTLLPLDHASGTLKIMKGLFKADFGVEPYLIADQAYFADPALTSVADGRYIWDPLDHGDTPDHISWSRQNGLTLAHAMLRWDSVGRDKPGMIAGPGDRLLKGPERLAKVLEETRDADILVLATWNDLGEGTGLDRAYDYWYQGRWQPPDLYIQMIRQAQGR
jgi:hypothetical protein